MEGWLRQCGAGGTRRFQTLTVPSKLPLANHFPAGLKATLVQAPRRSFPNALGCE
jgi:hypothetical protein